MSESVKVNLLMYHGKSGSRQGRAGQGRGGGIVLYVEGGGGEKMQKKKK